MITAAVEFAADKWVPLNALAAVGLVLWSGSVVWLARHTDGVAR